MNTVLDLEDNIYKYKLFTGDIKSYELCNIEKEITTLNIFKLFHDLTKMKEDLPNELKKGGAYTDVYLKYNSDGTLIENGLKDAETGDFAANRLKVYESLLSEVKTIIKDIREEFEKVNLVQKLGKNGISRGDARSGSNPAISSVEIDEDIDENFVGEEEFTNLSPENKQAFNNILNEVRRGGIINTLSYTEEGEKFNWGISNGDNDKRFILYTIYNRRAVLNEQLLEVAKSMNIQEKNGLFKSTYGKLKAAIVDLNENIRNLEVEYSKEQINNKNINRLISAIKKDKETVIQSHNDFVGKNKYVNLRPDSLVDASVIGENDDVLTQRTSAFSNGGGNPVKYKSTGQVVHIIFQNKKYKRVIYVKDKRNTKYCKMNNEYILLSKLKLIE